MINLAYKLKEKGLIVFENIKDCSLDVSGEYCFGLRTWHAIEYVYKMTLSPSLQYGYPLSKFQILQHSVLTYINQVTFSCKNKLLERIIFYIYLIPRRCFGNSIQIVCVIFPQAGL